MTLSESWTSALRAIGWRFLGNAVFPRLAYRLRWPSRLSFRGLLLYIAASTALLTALRAYLIGQAAHRDRINAELAPLLATNPTRDQLGAYIRARWGD